MKERFTIDLKGLLATVFMLLISVCAFPAHHAGAGIKVKSLGSNQYYVETFVMRDCSGAQHSAFTDIFSLRCGSGTVSQRTITHTPYISSVSEPFASPYAGITVTSGQNTLEAEEIGGLCDSILNPNIFPSSRCRTNPAGAQGYMKFNYSGIVTLPTCAWLRLSFGMPGPRNTGSSNISSSNLTVERFLNNQDFPLNSSPSFNDEHKIYSNACVGQTSTFSAGATDMDGDSLRYELTCINANAGFTGVCANYNIGFSPANPIGGAVMDSLTGLLTFTPATSGKRFIGYWVKEYERCTGRLIAQTRRDVCITSSVCSNRIPYVKNDFTNLQGSATRDPDGTIRVNEGATISWEQVFADSNFTDSVKIQCNIAQALPGASFSIIPTGIRNETRVRYTWTAVQRNTDERVFSTLFNDDVCNFIGQSATSTKIKLGKYVGITTGNTSKDSIWACIGDTVPLRATGSSRFTWRTTVIGDTLKEGINWFPDTNIGVDTAKTGKFVVTQTTMIELTGAGYVDFCGRRITGVGNVDTVVVVATDSFRLPSVLDSNLCLSDTNILSLPVSNSSLSYSYQWSPKNYLDYDTIANPRLVGLTTDQDFDVTVTSSGGCVREGKFGVLAAPELPVGSFISGPKAFLCAGDTGKIELNLGEIDYGSCGLSNVQCRTTLTNKTIGAGTLLNDTLATTNLPVVYYSSRKSGKMQLLYERNYLTANNVSKGLITSIGFNVDALPAVNTTYSDFTIKINCTNKSFLNTYATDTLYQVYFDTGYTPTIGWNTHVFDSGFVWDGNTNIIVEICWVNNSHRGSLPKMKFDRTAYVSSKTYVNPVSNNSCSETFIGLSTSVLPQTQFGFCTTSFADYNYQWNTVPSSTGGLLSPTNDTSVQFIASAGPVTYALTISDTLGACSQSIDTTITVLTKYNTKPDSLAPICANGGPINLTAPTPANVTTPGGSWSGAGITNSQQGRWDVAQSGSGTFMVYYEITGNNCASKDSTELTINPLPLGGIQPISYLCGKAGNVPEHQLVGLTPGGIFIGTGVDTHTVAGNTQYWIDGRKYAPTRTQPDTAVLRRVVSNGKCTNDTILKIPVQASWDTTYLGVLNNGQPILTKQFCATGGTDTLVVAGGNAIWKIIDTDPNNRAAMIDTTLGVFHPNLYNNGQGGKVPVEARNGGFCGDTGRYELELFIAPEVHILTEDYCFGVPGNCVGSNVPANKRTDTLLVRVAKYPNIKIDVNDPATYVDVVQATPANTGWANLNISLSHTKWDGYFWMNHADRGSHDFCSLPAGRYPIGYQLALAVGGRNGDSLCYSRMDTAVFMDKNFKVSATQTGSLCNDGTVQMNATSSPFTTGFLWSDGTAGTATSATTVGKYSVAASYKYCRDSAKVVVSNCVGIEEVASNLNASIFPNPAKDKVNIYAQGLGAEVTVQLLTVTGAEVEQFEVGTNHGKLELNLDISAVPAGVYLVKVLSEQQCGTYRVVIE